VKILIWKDSIISLRSLWGLIILITIIGSSPTLFIAWQLVEVTNDKELFSILLRNNFLFFPAMLIPMIGTVVFQTTLNEDRKSKALQILVADGIISEYIWISKLITSIIISYTFTFISSMIALIFSKILFQVWVSFDVLSLIIMIIIIPIISFTVLSIIGVIMWSSKQGHTLAGFIPVFSYIGCMYLNMYIMENNLVPKTGLILLLFAVSIIIFLVNILIVKNLSKEYIINMQI